MPTTGSCARQRDSSSSDSHLFSNSILFAIYLLPQRCRSAYVLAVTDRHSKYNLFEFSQSLSAFLAALDAEEQLEALRAAQKSLGDVGGSEGLPPVYDGYANQLDLTTVSLDLTELIARFPLADHNANWELARLLWPSTGP